MPPSPTARARRLAVGLVALALVLRLVFVVADTGFEPFADAADYDRHAVSLATTGAYPESTFVRAGGPTAFRPPAYPALLAAAYAVTGTADDRSRFLAGRVLGALCGTVLVALIGLLALRVWDRRTALVATGLAAVHLPFITVGGALLADGLFAVLVLAAVLAALTARDRAGAARWWLLAATGALAGGATLTRTNGLVVLGVLALVVWGRPWPRRASLVAPLVVVAAGLLVIAPWSARNTAAFGTLVPVSTQSGFTLAGTYNDLARTDPALPAKWRAVVVEPYAAALSRVDLDEAETDRALRAEARGYVREHPGYVLRAGFWNTVRLAGLQGADAERPVAPEIGIGGRLSDLQLHLFQGLALLALAGVLLGALRGRPRVLWVLPALLVLSMVLVTSPNTRYRVAIDAFLVLPAAVAVVGAARRVPGLRR